MHVKGLINELCFYAQMCGIHQGSWDQYKCDMWHCWIGPRRYKENKQNISIGAKAFAKWRKNFLNIAISNEGNHFKEKLLDLPGSTIFTMS